MLLYSNGEFTELFGSFGKEAATRRGVGIEKIRDCAARYDEGCCFAFFLAAIEEAPNEIVLHELEVRTMLYYVP